MTGRPISLARYLFWTFVSVVVAAVLAWLLVG